MNNTVLSEGTQVIIYIWTKTLDLLFNIFTFDGGVSVGWVIIAVNLIVIMIATILARPISNSIEWRRNARDE